MKIKLLACTPDAERIVASAAKVCYANGTVDDVMNTTDIQVEKFLEKLISIGHESPIEHVSFTFAVEGISRVLSHQLVRHRIASYSQQSQRYVKLDQFKYVIPPSFHKQTSSFHIFEKHMKDSQIAYDRIVDDMVHRQIEDFLGCAVSSVEDSKHLIPTKVFSGFEKRAIEDARFVFPNACATTMIFTMNARTLMNFFHHRCCDRAQWEIRGMANEMLRLVQKACPTLFKWAGASCVKGVCPEGKMSCGNLKTIE